MSDGSEMCTKPIFKSSLATGVMEADASEEASLLAGAVEAGADASSEAGAELSAPPEQAASARHITPARAAAMILLSFIVLLSSCRYMSRSVCAKETKKYA